MEIEFRRKPSLTRRLIGAAHEVGQADTELVVKGGVDLCQDRGAVHLESGLLGRAGHGGGGDQRSGPLAALLHARQERLHLGRRQAGRQSLGDRGVDVAGDQRIPLADRRGRGEADPVLAWIRMVAVNRLTGHSPGFFSVYTLPPNQAISPENQVKINEKLGQKPQYRDVRALILRKSMQLQGALTAAERWRLHAAAETAQILVRDAGSTTLRGVVTGG